MSQLTERQLHETAPPTAVRPELSRQPAQRTQKRTMLTAFSSSAAVGPSLALHELLDKLPHSHVKAELRVPDVVPPTEHCSLGLVHQHLHLAKLALGSQLHHLIMVPLPPIH
eukprot:6662809-Pyramimonas_sp.AAC.1